MSIAFQEKIKQQLEAKNMTAAELERRTGIPHAVVNILHGRSKNPSIKTAQAIAKELGCSIEELFGEADSAPNEPATKTAWDAQLYSAVFNAVTAAIEKQKLQPQPETVGLWLTEVYNYSLGSPDHKVDQRFVEWLLQRNN